MKYYESYISIWGKCIMVSRKAKIGLVSTTIIIAAALVTTVLVLGVPPTFDAPSLEFPIVETDRIDHLRPYGIPDWSGPGTHHNGIDLVINDSVTIVAPVNGRIMEISEHKNPHSVNNNVLFNILIKVNYGWDVKLVLEPNYDGDDEASNTLQRNAIAVSVMQDVKVGDTIAELIYANDGSHLHFMLDNLGTDKCAYAYSTSDSRSIFDNITINTGDQICIPV